MIIVKHKNIPLPSCEIRDILREERWRVDTERFSKAVSRPGLGKKDAQTSWLKKTEKEGFRTFMMSSNNHWSLRDFVRPWFTVLILSHSIFSSPLSGGGLVLNFVSLVDMSNLWDKRIIWVGVCQKGRDGEENLGDGQCWGPLILENIQANWTVGVDIWVVNSCGEVDLSWLERVVSWEMNVQEEDSSRVRRIIWSHDGCLPVVLVLLVDWTGGAVGGWIFSKINEFFLDSLDGRHLLYFG